MEEKIIPKTLEEAYRLCDSAGTISERDFYQEHVYHLRRQEYHAQGIQTEISSRRRERQRALEFSREMFFVEVADVVSGHNAFPNFAFLDEASCYAARLGTYTFLRQFASPQSEAVELYRRNYLELLRSGKPPREAYYLSQIIGPVGKREFQDLLRNVYSTGYPKGKLPYYVEKKIIQILDVSGGMLLILTTFVALLFAFVWVQTSPGTNPFIALGATANGALILIAVVVSIVYDREVP